MEEERFNGEVLLKKSIAQEYDDLSKLLKNFPEVLGCNLEEELKGNVKILDE
ncbi:hypothetical protein JHK82_043261 [Glycine max]|nr:hypothetical protein JHK82_043261 [Glycine max]